MFRFTIDPLPGPDALRWHALLSAALAAHGAAPDSPVGTLRGVRCMGARLIPDASGLVHLWPPADGSREQLVAWIDEGGHAGAIRSALAMVSP